MLMGEGMEEDGVWEFEGCVCMIPSYESTKYKLSRFCSITSNSVILLTCSSAVRSSVELFPSLPYNFPKKCPSISSPVMIQPTALEIQLHSRCPCPNVIGISQSRKGIENNIDIGTTILA